jgi:hypothetical protein
MLAMEQKGSTNIKKASGSRIAKAINQPASNKFPASWRKSWTFFGDC